MITNLERFRKDLGALVQLGDKLEWAMGLECYPEQARELLEKKFGKKTADYIKELPSFRQTYQNWYSEALALLRQLLPDRVADFTRHYEKPKARKDITSENYRIEDYLQGVEVTRGYQKIKVVGRDAAIPQFQQQLAIVQAAATRFESSLFEIRQLVQSDLLDSEIEAAEELVKKKFARPAGVLAGVVLERHLEQVCEDHSLTTRKKNPTIADFNEVLKAGKVIDVPQWRFIQHLGDIRNQCGHGRGPDPTVEQVTDLISGVKKVTKTVY